MQSCEIFCARVFGQKYSDSTCYLQLKQNTKSLPAQRDSNNQPPSVFGAKAHQFDTPVSSVQWRVTVEILILPKLL